MLDPFTPPAERYLDERVLLLFYTPLLNTAGPALLGVYLQPQGFRAYRFEYDFMVAVRFRTIGVRGPDRPVGVAFQVEYFPGSRYPAFAPARVVEPVDFHCGDFRGLREIVLNPLLRAFMGPPVEEGDIMVVRTCGFQ